MDYKLVTKRDPTRGAGYVDYRVERDDGVVIVFDRRGHGSCSVHFLGRVLRTMPPGVRPNIAPADVFAKACGDYFTRRTTVALLRESYRSTRDHFEKQAVEAQRDLERFEQDVTAAGGELANGKPDHNSGGAP